jgi:hypothetical protein
MRKMVAPKEMCIYDGGRIRKITVDFLRDLSALGGQEPILLDLRQTERITGGAALMLFAHVNTLQLFYKSKHRVKCLFPVKKNNPKGHTAVVKTGLSRALTSGSVEDLAQLVADGVPFQSANDPDIHAQKTVSYLTSRLGLPQGHQLVLMVTAAITEAMLNVKHHAYVASVPSKVFTGVLESRWWQYAMFDEPNDRFIFLLYDLGLGVVQSYKASLDVDTDDVHVFEEAMSYGFSRFRKEEPWRGNGSEDIKHPVDDASEFLLVYCDALRYTYRGGQPGVATINQTSSKLNGNLIEWKLMNVKKEAHYEQSH